jgi:hypothetical protein
MNTKQTQQRIINEIVSQKYNCDITLNVKKRNRNLVEARQIAMTLQYRLIDKISLSQVASTFNKDHATVLHSLKVVENLSQTDKLYNYDYRDLFQKCKKVISEMTIDLNRTQILYQLIKYDEALKLYPDFDIYKEKFTNLVTHLYE